MNLNFMRTIFGTLGGGTILWLATTLFGCKGDDPLTPIVEQAVCVGGAIAIPVQYQALAAFAFIAVGGILKWFKSGTVAQNLMAPSVPVVDKEDAKPGVVTEAQVASSK